MSARLSNRFTIVLVAAIIAVALAINPFATPVGADHQPADKIAVAGTTHEWMQSDQAGTPPPPFEPAADGPIVHLLGGTLRTSTPTDLIISVTSECALWTTIRTVGDDDSKAEARVVVWVEMNAERDPDTDDPLPNTGTPVLVASDDNEGGKVVFCDRLYRRVTSDLDNNEARIDTYNETKSANAFNWITLNVGNGIHTVDVFAELEADADAESPGGAFAKAGVGSRTLIVQPVKLANDVTI